MTSGGGFSDDAGESGAKAGAASADVSEDEATRWILQHFEATEDFRFAFLTADGIQGVFADVAVQAPLVAQLPEDESSCSRNCSRPADCYSWPGPLTVTVGGHASE